MTVGGIFSPSDVACAALKQVLCLAEGEQEGTCHLRCSSQFFGRGCLPLFWAVHGHVSARSLSLYVIGAEFNRLMASPRYTGAGSSQQ